MNRLPYPFVGSLAMKRALLVLAVIVSAVTLSAALAAAATIHVPGDQPNIQAAINAALPGDLVLVDPGTYVIGTTINANKASLTIQGSGSGSTTLQVAGAVGFCFNITGAGTVLRDFSIQKTDLVTNHNLIEVAASSVTVRDNVIYGPDPGTPWSVNGIVSRGLEVQGGLSGLLVQGNSIHHLRQPAYINPGTVGSIVNNNVSGTRGWVVDGAVLSFTGNTWGPPENQGAEIALLVSCSPANYPNLLAMSAANGDAYISGQFAGASSGRAIAYVNAAAGAGGFGDVTTPYQTVSTGVANALPGGAVQVAAGTYTEQVVVSGKNLSINGAGRASTKIQSPAVLASPFSPASTRQPVVALTGAADIEVHDLTVDGMGLGNGKNFVGVGFWNAGGKVIDCDIVHVRDTPFSGAQEGVSVYAFNNTSGPYSIEVGGCNLSDFQKNAFALNGTGLTANVHDCAITGQGNTTVTAQNGVQIAFGASGTVSNVSVSGMFYTPNTAAAAALLAYSGGSVTVTNFTVTACMVGAYYEDMNGSMNGVSVSGNTSGVPSNALIAYNDLASSANRLPRINAQRPILPSSPIMEDATGASVKKTLPTTSSAMSVSFGPGCLTGDGLTGSVGVLFYSNGGGLSGTATDLEMSNWGTAVATGGANASVIANHNSITGSLVDGYSSDPGNTNDATLNWWGAAGGPSGTNDVVGPVVYNPWLITGADFNPGCGFSAGPDNVVAVGPAPSCISQSNTCILIPVTIARTTSDNVRGFSVTVALSSSLQLCSGTSSVTQGTYLSSVGGTNFQVVDNLDGTYTVDCAILGTPCGATAATGTLFTLGVKKVGLDGTGTITVTDVTLRDCDNGPVAGSAGAPLSITIDTGSPAAIANLAAAQIKTGNDGDGTTKISLTFTAPGDAASVEVYRAGFGNYPEYDDAPGAGSVPATPSYAAAQLPPWQLTGVTATGMTDEVASRDFWYYVAFSKDACGNVSAVSNKTGGTLNYHLGDVALACAGNNLVNTADISFLGAHYGITLADPDPFGCLDVGPTTDFSVNARPTTDNKVNFEDLIMFAINYGQVSFTSPKVPEVLADRNAISLDAPHQVAAGQVVTVALRLRGAGDIQGLSAQLGWNPAIVAPLSVAAGQLALDQQAVVLSSAPGDVDVALLGVRETALAGDGVLATIAFRVVSSGDPQIVIARVDARGSDNLAVDSGLLGSPRAIPSVTEFKAPAPNPFKDRAVMQFSLAKAGPVELAIFSVDGRRVRTLLRETRDAGSYRLVWDGTDESGRAAKAGLFFARLTIGQARFSRTLIRIR